MPHEQPIKVKLCFWHSPETLTLYCPLH